MRRDARSHLLFWAITVFGVALDLITKIAVHSRYSDNLLEAVRFIPGVVGIYPHHNKGALFGLGGDHPTLLIAVSFVAMAVILWLFLSAKPHSRLTDVALAAMMAGAIGNQIDRLVLGSVRDFVQLLFVQWPVFNLADSWLVTGVGLMLLALILGDRGKGRSDRQAAGP